MGPQASPLELGASPIRFAIRCLRAYPSRANRSTAAQQFHALKQHYEGRATAHRREEETEFSNQALEFCIAHVPGGDEAEKVYRRRSMLAKRKQNHGGLGTLRDRTILSGHKHRKQAGRLRSQKKLRCSFLALYPVSRMACSRRTASALPS